MKEKWKKEVIKLALSFYLVYFILYFMYGLQYSIFYVKKREINDIFNHMLNFIHMNIAKHGIMSLFKDLMILDNETDGRRKFIFMFGCTVCLVVVAVINYMKPSIDIAIGELEKIKGKVSKNSSKQKKSNKGKGKVIKYENKRRCSQR